MIRALSVFVFIFFARTTAHSSPPGACTLTPGEIGGYPTLDILTERDLRDAIKCSVNRSGLDVIGENSFRASYHVSIPEEFTGKIKFQRRAENDPFSNRVNTYQVKFKGVFQERLGTTIRCDLRIEFRDIHKRRAVVANLNYCRSSEFGVITRAGKPIDLESWAVFSFLDGKRN